MIWGHNYVAFMLQRCVLWGAGLAGFVPMTPLVPMMAPDKKGRRTRPSELWLPAWNFAGPALGPVLAGSHRRGDVYYGVGPGLFSGIPGAVSSAREK